MMRIVTTALCLAASCAYSQLPPMPFAPGETLQYQVRALGMRAADLEVSVLPNQTIEGREHWHLRAQIRSDGVFGRMFYSVDNRIESLTAVDGFRPHLLTADLREKRRRARQSTFFDWRGGHARFIEAVHKGDTVHLNDIGWTLPDFALDAISAFFALRALPYEQDGEQILPIADDGKNLDLRIQYKGKKRIRTPSGRAGSLHLRVTFGVDGHFRGKGLEIWLSDDAQRRMLKVRYRLRLGWLTIRPADPPK